MTNTKAETYIAGRGLYQYDPAVFAEMMTRTCVDLRAVIAGVHDGDPELTKGMSALRKPELAAMCAEWETGKRENEREATLREQYADTPARFNPDVIDDVHAVALTENDRRTAPVTEAATEIAEELAEVSTVPFVAHDLANSDTGEIWTIAGSEDHGDHGMALFYGDDERGFSVLPPANLMHWGTKAVCYHGNTVTDSCPGCDALEEDVKDLLFRGGVDVTDGESIRLGTIGRHEDGTWAAMTGGEEVVGTGIIDADSAVRALRLDHKCRMHPFAIAADAVFDKYRAHATASRKMIDDINGR